MTSASSPPLQVAVPSQQQSEAQQGPVSATDLDPKQHDRPLRLWRLGLRIVATVFIVLSMILFVTRGARVIRETNCEDEDHGSRFNSGCNGYYDPAYNYDLVSLPIVCKYKSDS